MHDGADQGYGGCGQCADGGEVTDDKAFFLQVVQHDVAAELGAIVVIGHLGQFAERLALDVRSHHFFQAPAGIKHIDRQPGDLPF